MSINTLRIGLSSDTSAPGYAGATDGITSVESQNLTVTFNSTSSGGGYKIWMLSPGGTATTATDWQLIQQNITVANATNQTLAFTVPATFAADGNYVFRMGNSSTALQGSPAQSGAFTLDNSAPDAATGITAVDTNTDGDSANDGFIVTGNAAGAAAVQVDVLDGEGNVLGTQTATLAGGSFSASFTDVVPTPGDVTLRVTTFDAAGNPTATTVPYTTTACFLPGTMIATPEGERAIETLAIGDMVTTSEGKTAPIRWIGRNTVSLIFADKLRALPIRVTAGALDENVPSRDLLVSPDHALLVDGVLVHAGALVNGSTIVRETNVPSVFTYFHVELEDHSLILAENTPAETFIDNVDRMAFDNWQEHEALYAGSAPLVEMDLPRAKAHRQVAQSTRRRLAERAVALLPMAKTA